MGNRNTAMHRSKKTMMYHGRKGKPMIHTPKKGKPFIMVRKHKGGTKRLTLDAHGNVPKKHRT